MANATREKQFSVTAGIAAVVLWVVGVLLIGGGHLGFPGGLPEEAAGDVLTFYVTDADRITTGSWVFMLGALCFIWFVTQLASRLAAGAAGPATEGAARLASATGVVTGVLVLLSAASGLVTALGAEHLDAAAAQALDAVGGVFFVGAEMAGVVLLGSLALLARRTAALPRAWSTASLILALWLAVLPIGWVGLIAGVPLWTLATVTLLARRPAPQRSAAIFDSSAPLARAEASG